MCSVLWRTFRCFFSQGTETFITKNILMKQKSPATSCWLAVIKNWLKHLKFHPLSFFVDAHKVASIKWENVSWTIFSLIRVWKTCLVILRAQYKTKLFPREFLLVQRFLLFCESKFISTWGFSFLSHSLARFVYWQNFYEWHF